MPPKRREEQTPDRAVRHMAYAPGDMISTPVASSTMMEQPLMQFGVTRRGTPVLLPPGVSSLEKWSRTVLDFGKYMSLNLTYGQMISSADSDIRSYVKWCRGQVDNAEGFLKDFGMFILASEFSPDQGPVIPGTSHARKIR